MTARRTLPRECRLEDGRPKVRYETRAEAKDMARKHLLGERVYRCRHCRYFHLASPKQATETTENARG